MVVYDKATGEPFECESVDARELIASGAYTEKPEKPKATRKKKTEKESESEQG